MINLNGPLVKANNPQSNNSTFNSNKLDIAISKLNNMVNWLINDNILNKDHELINILNEYKSNSNELLKFIVLLSNISDREGNISDWKISIFLKNYNIDILDFSEDKLTKLRRYVKFFISLL